MFLWRNVNVIKACSVEFTDVVIKLLRVNKNHKYVHCNFINKLSFVNGPFDHYPEIGICAIAPCDSVTNLSSLI